MTAETKEFLKNKAIESVLFKVSIHLVKNGINEDEFFTNNLQMFHDQVEVEYDSLVEIWNKLSKK